MTHAVNSLKPTSTVKAAPAAQKSKPEKEETVKKVAAQANKIAPPPNRPADWLPSYTLSPYFRFPF